MQLYEEPTSIYKFIQEGDGPAGRNLQLPTTTYKFIQMPDAGNKRYTSYMQLSGQGIYNDLRLYNCPGRGA